MVHKPRKPGEGREKKASLCEKSSSQTPPNDSSAGHIEEALIGAAFAHAEGDGLGAVRTSGEVSLAIDAAVDPLIGAGAGELHPEPGALVG